MKRNRITKVNSQKDMKKMRINSEFLLQSSDFFH